MIDYIRISKRNLSQSEINKLVTKNGLTAINIDGYISYNNKIIKNMKGGLYIQIDRRRNLTITGSVHKYSSFKKGQKNTNFDVFTMKQAKNTVLQMMKDIGLNNTGTRITSFEVGINLEFSFDVKKIIKEVYFVESSKKEMYNNPKYKEESLYTTEFDRGKRVVYKIYDKTFEMQQKRHVVKPTNSILRMEILNRRPSREMTVLQFIEDKYLNKLQDNFFRKFNTLKYNAYVVAPKGTSLAKIELATELYKFGSEQMLERHKRKFENGVISSKVYYTYRKFIKQWDTLKSEYPQKHYDFMADWKIKYVAMFQLLNINRTL